MHVGRPLWAYLLGLLAAWGCVPSPPPPGVVRFESGKIPSSVAGPFPGLGPFLTSWDALLAACPLILGQRNATAGRSDDTSFPVRWRISNEYCAWLYYTPTHQYELSYLVESTEPLRANGEKGCRAPAFVENPRYPPRSLQYLYFLHNHPATPTNISEEDITAVAKIARIHGGSVQTEQGAVPVSIVAFISNAHPPEPFSCDGFYEYSHGSTEVLKWTPDAQGQWHKTPVGTVHWTSETDFQFVPAE